MLLCGLCPEGVRGFPLVCRWRSARARADVTACDVGLRNTSYPAHKIAGCRTALGSSNLTHKYGKLWIKRSSHMTVSLSVSGPSPST